MKRALCWLAAAIAAIPGTAVLFAAMLACGLLLTVTGPLIWAVRARKHRLTQAEKDARKIMRMNPGHPEWLTRELPGADEDWLVEVGTALWPDDEFADIIRETGGEAA